VRASLSISSNIAEACGRGTQREFQRFIAIAQGSAQELLSQLRIARRIGTALNGSLTVSLENRTALILKMLGRLHANPPPPRQADASA
jgi:four helix bundle protein